MSKTQGKKLDALAFYKNEMKTQLKLSHRTKEMTWGDQFLLWVNYFSSNFGQSYWIPFFWIIGLSFLFYNLMTNYGDYGMTRVGSIEEHDWSLVWQGIHEYTYFWNPAHKSSEGINAVGKNVDFLSRLLIGYFLYHFIRATRRFAFK